MGWEHLIKTTREANANGEHLKHLMMEKKKWESQVQCARKNTRTSHRARDGPEMAPEAHQEAGEKEQVLQPIQPTTYRII